MATFSDGATTRKHWGTDCKILRPKKEFRLNNTQLGLQPSKMPERWRKGGSDSFLATTDRRWRLEDDSSHNGLVRPDYISRWQR